MLQLLSQCGPLEVREAPVVKRFTALLDKCCGAKHRTRIVRQPPQNEPLVAGSLIPNRDVGFATRQIRKRGRRYELDLRVDRLAE